MSAVGAHPLHHRCGGDRGPTRPRGRPAAARLAVLWVLVALLWAGCEPEEDQSRPQAHDRIPQQVVAGLVLRESKAGTLSWVLRADSAYVFGEGERTLLDGVRINFYNETGDSVRSWLTARAGEMDPATHDLIARDSVVVTTSDGNRLETEELKWDQERELVVSDRFVRLTRGRSVVTGVGIESDASLNSYRILSQVSGELHEEPAREPSRAPGPSPEGGSPETPEERAPRDDSVPGP